MLQFFIDYVGSAFNNVFWFICEYIFRWFRFIEIIPNVFSLLFDSVRTIISYNNAVFSSIFNTIGNTFKTITTFLSAVNQFSSKSSDVISMIPSYVYGSFTGYLNDTRDVIDDFWNKSHTNVFTLLSSSPKLMMHCLLEYLKNLGFEIVKFVLVQPFQYVKFYISESCTITQDTISAIPEKTLDFYHFCSCKDTGFKMLVVLTQTVGHIMSLMLNLFFDVAISVSTFLSRHSDSVWKSLVNITYPVLELLAMSGESIAVASKTSFTFIITNVFRFFAFIGRSGNYIWGEGTSIMFILCHAIKDCIEYCFQILTLPFTIVNSVIQELVLYDFLLGIFLLSLFTVCSVYLFKQRTITDYLFLSMISPMRVCRTVFQAVQNALPRRTVVIHHVSQDQAQPGVLGTVAEEKDDGVGINQTEENLTCVICQDNKRSVLVLPCRHLCLCSDCLDRMFRMNRRAKCPLCRSIVRDFLDVYM